jgi:hypothetical protein
VSSQNKEPQCNCITISDYTSDSERLVFCLCIAFPFRTQRLRRVHGQRASYFEDRIFDRIDVELKLLWLPSVSATKYARSSFQAERATLKWKQLCTS